MKQYSPVSRFFLLLPLLVFFISSCKKVNEATELGNDLIPVVDNVYTFDTILQVSTLNFPFTTEDSSSSGSGDIHFVGSITADPLFGTTNATLFLQLKPQNYLLPFGFDSVSNLIALDSVVMVLSYRNHYGDSTLPQQLRVYEMDQSNVFRYDSAYMIRSNNFTYSAPLSAPVSILPSSLNDSLKPFGESAAGQLRIRLDDAFGNRLLRNYDSTNAYKNDSLYNTNIKGFAVTPEGGLGNALIGVSLTDTNTKLAVYYRYVDNGITDTAVTYFRFNSVSASANYIQRDRSVSEFAAVAGDNVEDQLVYLQNAPGTFAKVLVPGLAGLNNRIIHRAELIVEQVADNPLYKIMTPPTLLYLDAFDAASNVYRTVPFDAAFDQTGALSAAAFGMYPGQATDQSGNLISVWRFNVSRYVQRVANGVLPAYSFRLYSPFVARTNIGTSSTVQTFGVNPTFATGRVRVGGGTHPTQPMRLRIIYSKL